LNDCLRLTVSKGMRDDYALFSLTQTATRYVVGITASVQGGDLPDGTKQIVDDLILYALFRGFTFILLTSSSRL
jgi:hypothetical protein